MPDRDQTEEAVEASRVIATNLNALNREMHVVAEWMRPEDWTRRNVPGTNLPGFTFWHIVRVIDSTAFMSLRGLPELIDSEPWASKKWARPGIGTGYTLEEADETATRVVPAELVGYADALRTAVSQWLRSVTDEELQAPSRLIERARALAAYNNQALIDSLRPLDGQPAWLVLSLAAFAHGWAHLEEIRLLVGVGRQATD